MLEELKRLNIQSDREEITYFLCNVVGTSPITRNDAMVLCSHAPGKHHLSCDDLMTYCAAFGWIIILDNTLLLADDLKEHVKHGRQINDYLIKSAVNLLFDSDILGADMFFYDSVQSQYGFKNECFPLKLSSVRNVLLSQGFLRVNRSIAGSHFYVSPEYETLVASHCVKKRKAMSLEQLKKRLENNELAGEKAELFALEYEHRRLGPEGGTKVKRISDIDVSAGYDIVSVNTPDSLKTNRFIEVKAISEAGFFWSKNEYEVAKLLATDYYLYLIDLTKIYDDNYEPEIINNPAQQIMENSLWLIEPQSYHIQKIDF